MGTRKCSDLKQGESVVFRLNGTLYDGVVTFNDPDTQRVGCAYFRGGGSESEVIPYSDMVSVGNPDGQEQRFGNIHGFGDWLIPE